MLLRKRETDKAHCHSRDEKKSVSRSNYTDDLKSTSKDKSFNENNTKNKRVENVRAKFSQSTDRRMNIETKPDQKTPKFNNFNISKQVNSITQSKHTNSLDTSNYTNNNFPKVNQAISKQATRDTLILRNSDLSNFKNKFDKNAFYSTLNCDVPTPCVKNYSKIDSDRRHILTTRSISKVNLHLSQSLDLTGLDVHQNDLSGNQSPNLKKTSMQKIQIMDSKISSTINSRDTLRNLIKDRKYDSGNSDEKIQIIHSKSERKNGIPHQETSRGSSKSRKRFKKAKPSFYAKNESFITPVKQYGLHNNSQLYKDEILNTFDPEIIEDLERNGGSTRFIEKYMEYVSGASGKKYSAYKESKIPRLKKYIKGEHQKYNNAVQLLKSVDMRMLNDLNTNFDSFLYGNPISFDMTPDFKASQKMNLLDQTYNIIALNVLNYQGPVKVIISEPVDQVFWISTQTPNPTKENHDKFFDNVDCFTMFFDDYGFNHIFMKVLALQNCEFVITIKAQTKRDKFKKNNTKINNSYSEGTKNPKYEKFKIRPFTNQNETEKRKVKPYITHRQLLDEIGNLDIFLEKKHGTEYVPKKSIDREDFVETNIKIAKNNTKLAKTCRIRQRSLDQAENLQTSKNKRDITYAQIIGSKIGFQERHNVLKHKRINDEIDDVQFKEKRFRDVNWIYLITVLGFVDLIFWRFKHWKLKAFIKKVQERKLIGLQRYLRKVLILQEPREIRALYHSRLCFRMKVLYTKKNVQKKCIKFLGTLLRGYGKTSRLLQYFQQYVLSIRNIQKKFRYTMSWKRMMTDKFFKAWEKEVSNIDHWENDRNLRLNARKLPRDKFCIKNNLHYFSRNAQFNVASYMINMALLNYIDMKLANSSIIAPIRDSQIAMKQMNLNVYLEECEYSGSIFDTERYKTGSSTTKFEKKLENTFSNFEEPSFAQRYCRNNQEKSFQAKKWEKFALLIEKAISVKEDFADYYPEFEENEIIAESPTSKARNSRHLQHTKKQNSRVSSKSPTKILKPKIIEEEHTEETEFINKMVKMLWNKNIRATMPKQLSFTYEYDPPLMRALIYYIIQNMSKNTVNYDYIDLLDINYHTEDLNESQEKVGSLVGLFMSKKGTETIVANKKNAGFNLGKMASFMGNKTKIEKLASEQVKINETRRKKKSQHSKSPAKIKNLSKKKTYTAQLTDKHCKNKL